jgi:DNA mismatch endonuclease, patch repair protein
MMPGARSPIASSEQAQRRMQRQGQRDTRPELAIRRILHSLGYRYRVDYRIPGMRAKADLAFTRVRVAVFIDGCFWHQCLEHGTLPKHNRKWWKAKLRANSRRDAEIDTRLTSCGWTVIRLWEHETPVHAAEQIGRTVDVRRTSC